MASFFGEVLPVVSRACDDDEEDDQPTVDRSPPAVIRWCPAVREELKNEGSVQCKELIIAVGPCAAGFCHAYLTGNSSEKIGVIGTDLGTNVIGSFAQNSASDRTCYVHRLKNQPEFCVCMCKSVVTESQAFSWCEKLLTSFDRARTRVLVLSSSLVSEYRSDSPPSELKTPFLTALTTDRFKDRAAAAYLPQPNMVTGLTAQILTHCQVGGFAAILYHSYVDTLTVDSVSVSAFRKLLKRPPFSLVKTKPDIKLLAAHDSDNPLYI